MFNLQQELLNLLKKHPDPRKGASGIIEFCQQMEAMRGLPRLGIVSDNKDPMRLGRVRVASELIGPGAVTSWIPVISMYALALYRMLPAINRILGYANQIAYQQRSLQIIYDDLNLETVEEGSAQLSFKKTIRGENLWFSYLSGADVIKNVSFEIKKGEKIAFTGESGSGKTTLVDIVIGIYRPLKGSLFIDDVLVDETNIRSWRSKVGYIPQNIFLFDGTVAENITFGSKPDEEKIISSSQV